MTLKRVKERFADYQNALKRLEEALHEDLAKGSIIMDGTIQRFEFTFELGWKLIKDILNYNSIEVSIPRMVIKEAFQKKIIKDGQGWIDMLEDRNRTVHIYDQQDAETIYYRIKDDYFELLKMLNKHAVEFMDTTKF